MWDIGKASRRTPAVRPRNRNGGFSKSCGLGLSGPGAGSPMLVDGARGSRCPAPPRHALLAENLGKPSLWVNIKDLWYLARPHIAAVPQSRFTHNPLAKCDD